jgi:hypothetical protein
MGPWVEELERADAVVNLAGRSVDCRYTVKNRRRIWNSRIESTRILGEAIARAANPPRLWLNASTATIYRHTLDHPELDWPMGEDTGELGGGESAAPESWRFSVDTARAWERTLFDANTPQTRRIALRSSMVMSPDSGGVFDTLLRLVRFGLGGTAGDGRQYVSWIHDADFLAAVRFLMADPEIEGSVNVTSPQPLPNSDFMRELREAWGEPGIAPLGLPAPRWLLEIGAFFLRTETELLLKSRRVEPARLLDAGFEFSFPEWSSAARDLILRWRRG